MKSKLIKVTTVPISLDLLLTGQLNYLNQYYTVIGVSSKGDSLQKVEKREGIMVHSINIQRKIAPFSDLVSLWKLYKYFRKENPEIVHSITPKAGLLSMVASYLSGVPIRIHTFTGLIFPYKSGLIKYFLILMDKLTCRFSTQVYAEGQGVKNDLEYYNITKKPLKIIRNGNVNGIDTHYFSLDHFSEKEILQKKKEIQIPLNDVVFTFVGRIVKDKGIDELVMAFTSMQKHHSNCSLLLVGTYEDDLDPITDLTREQIESNPKIISIGFQQDVRIYYALSTIFVFPSYREGFPNTVMQAGAMNLPSIVTDINGCNEIIENEINGLIINKKDTVELQKAMLLLMNNKSLREKLKNNSRKMITDRFERSEFWDSLLVEYKSLQNKL